MGARSQIKHNRRLLFQLFSSGKHIVFDSSEERAGSRALLRKARARCSSKPRPEPSVRLNPAPRLWRRPPGRPQMRLPSQRGRAGLPLRKPRDSRRPALRAQARPWCTPSITVCLSCPESLPVSVHSAWAQGGRGWMVSIPELSPGSFVKKMLLTFS